MSKNNKAKRKTSPALIVLIIVFGVVFIVCGFFLLTRIIKNNSEDDYTIPPEYVVEYPDVEAYFEENSQIVSVVPVSKSQDVYTEKDVTELLEGRGFTEYVITTSYSIDGAFKDETEVSNASSEKHPMYVTYFVSSQNALWTIMVIDGVILANPVSYNVEYPDAVSVVVSEQKEIVSYDSSTNSFYRTIPNVDAVDVRVVDVINAETLESLTMEELANG